MRRIAIPAMHISHDSQYPDFPLVSGFVRGLLALSIVAPLRPVMTIMANTSVRGCMKESLRITCGGIRGDVIWLALGHHRCGRFSQPPRTLGRYAGSGPPAVLDGLEYLAQDALRPARYPGPDSWKIGFVAALTSLFWLAGWLANGTLLDTVWGWPWIAALFVTGCLYAACFYPCVPPGGAQSGICHVVGGLCLVSRCSPVSVWMSVGPRCAYHGTDASLDDEPGTPGTVSVLTCRWRLKPPCMSFPV